MKNDYFKTFIMKFNYNAVSQLLLQLGGSLTDYHAPGLGYENQMISLLRELK